jgi:hypothetical protein
MAAALASGMALGLCAVAHLATSQVLLVAIFPLAIVAMARFMA